jgi:hypothetical protein
MATLKSKSKHDGQHHLNFYISEILWRRIKQKAQRQTDEDGIPVRVSHVIIQWAKTLPPTDEERRNAKSARPLRVASG